MRESELLEAPDAGFVVLEAAVGSTVAYSSTTRSQGVTETGQKPALGVCHPAAWACGRRRGLWRRECGGPALAAAGPRLGRPTGRWLSSRS